MTVENGKTFTGDSGGILGTGKTVGVGRLYTDDLEKLYRETASFMYTVAIAYAALYFFDKNSEPLGHYQALSSVPIYVGTGGGTGKWK